MTDGRTRIPSLGPRGEGWVGAQLILFVAIAGFGVRDLEGHGLGAGMPFIVPAAGLALAAVGLLLAIRAIRDLGRSLSPFPRPPQGATLVDTGAYRFVRHPIYTGLVLAAAGWSLASGSLWAAASSLALLAVLDAKSRREEAWLTETFAGYPAYRARTKRLIPFVY
ncbi:MAG TPA: isoprenylcysteine carboxylmethyltransferase family protein [Candidatus Limnocylindrales bacterium]|nr:isoprenylcysteine carboxylmethyltransferase family protein [Candidatus Limnocylindrales bacterium]